MPTLSPIAAQLVALVRQMPDEAILALVRDQLGAIDMVSSPAVRQPARRAARKASKASKAPRRAAKRTGRAVPARGAADGGATQRARRAELVAAVEKFVKASKGVGLADVAAATKSTKDRAKAALKELKSAGRIAHGGDRKFTRYAATKAIALAASLKARAGN